MKRDTEFKLSTFRQAEAACNLTITLLPLRCFPFENNTLKKENDVQSPLFSGSKKKLRLVPPKNIFIPKVVSTQKYILLWM